MEEIYKKFSIQDPITFSYLTLICVYNFSLNIYCYMFSFTYIIIKALLNIFLASLIASQE